MIFVGIGREGSQNRRVHVGHFRWEQRFIAEVHQRFVGVVAQEGFYVGFPACSGVQLFGITQLVIVQIHQQIERKPFQLFPFCFTDFLQPFLILIANVIAMYRFIPNDQANQIGGVGQLAAA